MLGDTHHHVQFMKKVLEHKNQNQRIIKSKFDSFFDKRRIAKFQKINRKTILKTSRVTSVKFYRVSKMHLFTCSCIISSYKVAGVHRPRLVYSSLPKVMSRVYTKRSVLRRVRKRLEKYYQNWFSDNSPFYWNSLNKYFSIIQCCQ